MNRIPFDKYDLKIKKTDHVLEVGSGNWPHYRSDILVDKSLISNADRCDDLYRYEHQHLIIGEGEDLPFANKTFDYSICCHSLEHSDDPAMYLEELMRVSKRGYIETPSLIGEFLFPKKSHKWVILFIDNKLVFLEKSFLQDKFKFDFGQLFLNYLPYNSLIWKLFWITDSIMNVKVEWNDRIEYVINPDNVYLSYFTKTWVNKMSIHTFPKKPILRQVLRMIRGLFHLLKVKIIQKKNSKKKLIRILDELTKNAVEEINKLNYYEK